MNSICHVLLTPEAYRCRFGTSRFSSVLHNFATSGHLVFQPDSLSNPFTSPSIVIPGIQNVCPFSRQLHRQAPMAQELVDSSFPLVHRCRRLQTSRTQVILAHPRPHRERLKQGLGIGWDWLSQPDGIPFECDHSRVEFARGPGSSEIARDRVGLNHILTNRIGSMT